jgi:nitrate reductase assembly molybdenum cofactor insertion protein NarJ
VSSVTAPPAADGAALLRLLSLALAPPAPETVDEARLLAGVLAERPGARPELAELEEALADLDAEQVGIAHEHVFSPAGLSPYEATTELDPFRQARLQADVAGFYAAFGAEAHGSAAERPDHAGTELEFLAFLALRRLDCRDADEAERLAAIEEAFWLEHAGRWLPAFFDTLAADAPDAFHRAVGRLGAGVVADALATRGLEPDPAPRARAARLAVEADELECGGADLQSPIEQLAEPHRRRRG